MTDMFTDLIVDACIIGSGIAGLRVAVEIKLRKPDWNVLVITSQGPDVSSSFLAQGGVAVAVGNDDHPDLHAKDTMTAGDGLCNPRMVNILCNEMLKEFKWLQEFVEFDKDDKGNLLLGQEGAHSRRRILHVKGDQTGRYLLEGLYAKAKSLDVKFLFNTTVFKLLSHHNVIDGCLAWNRERSEGYRIVTSHIVLATGGVSSLYAHSTNPFTNIGSGIILAWEIGAPLADLEFLQFHPTTCRYETKDGQIRTFLVSEAVRGEGARLMNSEGEYFMERYSPLKDLAPRDIVARAILNEIMEGRGKKGQVYLDARFLGTEYFQHRFPMIYQLCKEIGIDPGKDLIPVAPAAHYFMGGIFVNEWGQVPGIEGLYAVGECACTGVHGANRLASNSLAECLVFGKRVGIQITAKKISRKPITSSEVPMTQHFENVFPEIMEKFNAKVKLEIQETMWKMVGILRSEKTLNNALEIINNLSQELKRIKRAIGSESKITPLEIQVNWRLTMARLITESALRRKESRGAHYRKDYPRRDDKSWLVRIKRTFNNFTVLKI